MHAVVASPPEAAAGMRALALDGTRNELSGAWVGPRMPGQACEGASDPPLESSDGEARPLNPRATPLPAARSPAAMSASQEKSVDSTKEAAAGPWRLYLEVMVQRFDRSLLYNELLEKVDAVYDRNALVFTNNFITTFGGTDNAVALWRFLGAPVTRIDLKIQDIQVRYQPKETGEGAAEDPRGAVLELCVVSEQLWHIPPLLLLVRAVFGAALSVRLTSTLGLDPVTGKVTWQRDNVHNWLTMPLLLRFLLGLAVPLVVALIKP